MYSEHLGINGQKQGTLTLDIEVFNDPAKRPKATLTAGDYHAQLHRAGHLLMAPGHCRD